MGYKTGLAIVSGKKKSVKCLPPTYTSTVGCV
jgi:hypothetical protein